MSDLTRCGRSLAEGIRFSIVTSGYGAVLHVGVLLYRYVVNEAVDLCAQRVVGHQSIDDGCGWVLYMSNISWSSQVVLLYEHIIGFPSLSGHFAE